MELIADGVLILAALAAMAYCMVLSRRLRRLTELDGGLGAAITALSREVDHLSGALAEAKSATTDSATDLGAQCRAAHIAARRLETLVKSANKTVLSKGGGTPVQGQSKADFDPSETETPDQEQTAEMKDRRPVSASTGTPKADPAPVAPPAKGAPPDTAPEPVDTITIAEKKTRSKATRKPKSAPASKPKVTPNRATDPDLDPAPELALGDASSIATLDGAALDQFVEAIITKADADDNAALARRLVMALAAQQTSRSK